MVLETMTTKKSRLFVKKSCLLFLISLIFPLYAEDTASKWTIAAQKFSYARGQKSNSVTESTAEMIPSGILEKLSKSFERNVMPDERFERTRYSLRTERQSLYLQLNSEYQKRDSIVLNDYTESQIKSNIQKQNKKISEIKEKIDENLQKLKEAEAENEEKMKLYAEGKFESESQESESQNSEMKKFSNFFKHIFVKDESIITRENIVFYNSDSNYLYKPTDEAIEAGYLSYLMEKNVYSAGINTLITGKITNYDDYISVSADVYLYPGARKIGTVVEIGSVDDMDFITSSIANQIIPLLTNSMPVNIEYKVEPAEALENCYIYIDDVLQQTESNKIVLESGVHTIQFVSKGFQTVEASYYFEGNKNFNIDVNFKSISEGYIQIGLVKPILGDIFVNGEKSFAVNEQKSQIKINGNKVFGEFRAEDGTSAYFYVPDNLYFDGSYVKIKPKPFDREKYIDTRRKWMYASYSLLMTSLIPYFYCYGNLTNKSKLYYNRMISYDEAMKWQNATNICSGICIGLGVFWGFELVRYFIAANSVLPQKAKAGDISEYEYVDVEEYLQAQKESAENAEENIENTEGVE